MNLTIVQEVTVLNLSVEYNGAIININPVVNTGGSVLTGIQSNKKLFTTTEGQTDFIIPSGYDTIEFNLGGMMLFEGDDYTYDAITSTATTISAQPQGLKASIRGYNSSSFKKERLTITADNQFLFNINDKPKQIDVNLEGNTLFENDDYTYSPITGNFQIIENYYINMITTQTRLEVSKIF